MAVDKIILILAIIVQVFASEPVLKSNYSNLVCNSASQSKWTYIRTSYSQKDHCTYRIQPFSSSVCQIRVDFTMNFPQPTDQPNDPGMIPQCTQSYLKIGPYKFCGINSDQHIYLSHNSTTNHTIEVVRGQGYFSWFVTVTQLECSLIKNSQSNIVEESEEETRFNDADFIAPNGCLQYYRERYGSFQSFNYNMGNGPYPPNMRYSICFSRPPFATAIQFSASVFQLSHHDSVIMTNQMCYEENTHGYSNDYLFVPFSRITEDGISGTHYCGDILESKQLESTMPGPFVVIFNSGDFIMPQQPAYYPSAFRIKFKII